MKKGWKKVKLGDFIEFNPKETLSKKTVAKYIEMANLQCFMRDILGYELKEYNGGTKFRNGDTLVARITPCLENGKTAYISCLEDDELAFGSTEYIILREKEGTSDRKYIYYMGISDNFRGIAIKSMTGTSGRQRVQNDALMSAIVEVPTLETQQKIASILSSLDDKIEVNNEINKTLEEMAQTLFKQWFVDFEFPDKNGKPYTSNGGKMIKSKLGDIPDGWRVGVLREIVKETIGGDWGKEELQGNFTEKVFCIRGADIVDSSKGFFEKVPVRYILSKNFDNKKLLPGDLIIEISGGSPIQSTGRIGYVNDLILDNFYNKLITTNFCRIIRLHNSKNLFFTYTYWKKLYDDGLFFQFENGTTGIKNLDINGFLDSFPVVIPSEEIITEFVNILEKNYDKIQENGKEIKRLTEIRDFLLPKLMSGEVDV